MQNKSGRRSRDVIREFDFLAFKARILLRYMTRIYNLTCIMLKSNMERKIQRIKIITA